LFDTGKGGGGRVPLTRLAREHGLEVAIVSRDF
jgi:hypothetical protein